MWSNRFVQAKDLKMERISAKDLSMELFQKNYIDKNIPVIISDLNLSSSDIAAHGIQSMDKYLDNNLLLQNVFVSNNKQNRFLYFDRDIDDDKHNDDKSQMRTKMKWNEFKQRISITDDNNNDYKPYLNKKERYYLYGENIPESLSKHIVFPSFLPLDENDDDNCLLWMSSHRTCSPLHFDFCEGFLCQLHGMKRVCLFRFDVDKLSSFYPFPFDSKHKRQSMINDIHKVDCNKFGLFATDDTLNGYQGVIKQNEGLYIPFSWWHQIEGDEKYGSISLSFRWNPYFNDVRNAILTASKMNNTMLSDIIFNECVSKTPFYIKNIAAIWREIFNSKRNNDNNDNNDNNNEIDLFGVD